MGNRGDVLHCRVVRDRTIGRVTVGSMRMLLVTAVVAAAGPRAASEKQPAGKVHAPAVDASQRDVSVVQEASLLPNHCLNVPGPRPLRAKRPPKT